MAKLEFKHVTADMPIIGFTGALGSGCSFLSRGLADHHNYMYCSLSQPIHESLAKQKIEPTSKNLQDEGNKLRAAHGLDCLVAATLEWVDGELPKRPAGKPVGLIVDGIRNTGEINALRAWPHFYLVSVQADQELRKVRVLRAGKRCKTELEFRAADARDADEDTASGQQVKWCNYLADIIVLNEEELSRDAILNRQKYISEKLYNRYVMLIEHLSRGARPRENRAGVEAALMTAAYVESKRSSCLKRKVGAVIASKEGNLISAGHNDVPESMKPCIEDPNYGWCARDMIQEKSGQEIKNCPNCGKEIKLDIKCDGCGHQIDAFVKRCPNCHRDLDIDCICPSCKVDIFKKFLPGADPARTGKLLDMCRALHAEENAILTLSRTGVRVPDGAVLYCTTFPCNLCANKIVTVGIKSVVYAEPYSMRDAEKVFKEKGVTLKRFEGVKSNAYFRMYS